MAARNLPWWRTTLLLAAVAHTMGCAPESAPGVPTRDGGTGDGGRVGNPSDGGDDEDCDPSACGPEELCGDDGEGNGLDDDCNGSVDESCSCPATGVTRSCFEGEPDQQGVGTCADGVMTCSEFLTWGECVGGQPPEEESCDGADNDCDGTVDDGLSGCETAVECPGVQLAAPLNRFPLNGGDIFSGDATAWRWEIECPSTVSPCPLPVDPRSRNTSVFFVQSGSYRARLEVDAAGDTLSCEWVINVQGSGLRVELLWDTQGEGNGNTDVDLHLHRKSVPGPSGETSWFTEQDCYFGNCKASTYGDGLREAWDLADSEGLDACRDAPHGQGAVWEELGACYNPRLDVDVIRCDPSVVDPEDTAFCAPENINIDNPAPGEPYRVMVNYWSDHDYDGPTRPTVNIYCGGELRASLGEGIVLRNGRGLGATNDNWLVADVVFRPSGGRCGGPLRCDVEPLDVIRNDRRFGPPWSF
jgi:hypothetical protein